MLFLSVRIHIYALSDGRAVYNGCKYAREAHHFHSHAVCLNHRLSIPAQCCNSRGALLLGERVEKKKCKAPGV